MNDYTKAAIKRIKQRAMRQTKAVRSISHILPRAFCIAKPAAYMAVFVVPPVDREKCVKRDAFACVQDESCADVRFGDWAQLAYISTKTSGMMKVIKP